MSVNGDLMVVRNGRSTSQVSVYNYPEHLNPFYEDDNHKRLRFWKLNKGAKDGQGRRNSFSLGGLKDMWAFKSFRMKKKSSSLGINKTSESPPPLRRDIFAQENGYSTYDPRMRYTTGATNGIGGANAFQRNVPYRSSLQDMRSSQPVTPINGIGFNRNDRYRSTIQTAATTSGTSSSSPTQSLTLPQPRRSSQTSVASTNPFDDDDDDDVVMGSASATSTPSKNPGRKKRRAPPPPVPAHQIIKEESSSAGSTPSHKPSTTAQENERLEIQNLTAEIESFVNSSNSDDVCVSANTTTQSNTVSNSPKQNGTIPKVHTSPTQKPNGAVTKDVDIIVTNDSEPLFIREDEDIERDSPVKIVEKPIQPVREIGHVEAIHVHVENTRSTPEKIEPSRVSTFRSEVKTESPEKAPKRASPEKQVSSTRVVQIVEVHKSTEKTEKPVESLKIKESPEKPKIAAKPNIPRSPPPVSPRMTRVTREESYPIETPDTPAMRRREIKIEADLPSTPDSSRREIETFTPAVKAQVNASPPPASEVSQREIETSASATKPPQEKETAAPATKPKEVSITVVTTTTTTRTSEKPASPEAPVPTLRENKTITTERTSPLPAARKVITTEKVISQVQSTKKDVEPPQIEVEEKISNLDAKLPQLQLKISEEPPKQENVVLEVSKPSEDQSTETSVASTSSAAGVHPAPIDKPPRAKHFVEEIPEDIYRPRPSQWKQSTLAPLEPVPPEKRRSVKQIIESINRSQRLLNGKKVDEPEIEATDTDSQRNMSESNTNAMEQNLKSLAESQREMKRMLEELDGLENTHHEQKLSNRSDENFQGILDTIVSTLARETAKKGNGEVFKKCTITKEVTTTSRESSPTSSNLDWNPVPKPKRTKNLSPELQVKRNNTDTE